METIIPVNSDERYADTAGMSYLAIDQYRRELAWIEPLPYEEHKMLLARVARAQRFPENAHYALIAKDARDRLVEQYQPMVFKMARRLVRHVDGMEVLDLVNEGACGVMRAIDTYHQYPHFSERFPVLVTLCVSHALSLACSHAAWVPLAPQVSALLSKMRKVSAHFEREHGELPSSAHLASLLEVPEEKILEAEYFASYQSVVSLEALSYEDEQVEESHRFVSLFQASVVTENHHQAELKTLFEQVFEQVLTERERCILQVRYGLGDQVCAQTAQETANELGISRSTVESLYYRASRRLYDVLEPLMSSEHGRDTITAQLGDYYSINEAAARLQVSPSTIRNYMAQGRLPAQRGVSRSGGSSRRWMLPKEAVDALLLQRDLSDLIA